MNRLLVLAAFMTSFSTTLSAQGYFHWAWPNEGIPDSIYNYLIEDGKEELEIRQYFVYNQDRIILIDSSFFYFSGNMNWVQLSKTETILDIHGDIKAKRYYYDDFADWVLNEIDSVVMISPGHYQITRYSVNEDGMPESVENHIVYYLDQLGRDSLQVAYNEAMVPDWKEEYHQNEDYLSVESFNWGQSAWNVFQVDSLTFYSNFYTYNTDEVDENGQLVNYSIDTIFLDEKGRLDFDRFYVNTGNGYEYVYKHIFFHSDPVSIDQPSSPAILECGFDIQPSGLVDLEQEPGRLTLWSVDGRPVMNADVPGGQLSLPDRTQAGIYILRMRYPSGRSCMQKVILVP